MKLHKKRSNIFVSVIKENYSLLIVLIGLTFLISIQGCQPSEPTLTIGGPTCCEILKLDGTTESCISDINEVKCSESVTTGGYNFYYNGCRDVPSCLDIIKLSSVADLKENNLVFAHSSDLSKLYKYDFNKGSNELIQSFTNNIIRIDFIEDNLVTAWTAPYGGPYTANIVDLNKKSILKSYSTWPNYTYPRIYKINNNYYYYALNKPNSLEFYLTKINLDTAQQTNVLYKPFLGYSVDGILYDDYNIILFYWGSPGLGSYRHEIISVNVNTDKETILFSETRSSSTDILYKVINSKADNNVLIADIYSKDPKYDPLRYHTRAFDLINNRQYQLDAQYRAASNEIAIYNYGRFTVKNNIFDTRFMPNHFLAKKTISYTGKLMNNEYIISDMAINYYYTGQCKDSDKGLIYNVTGHVSGYEIINDTAVYRDVKEDSCINQNTVLEYFCDSIGYIQNQQYICEGKCAYGACYGECDTNIDCPRGKSCINKVCVEAVCDNRLCEEGEDYNNCPSDCKVNADLVVYTIKKELYNIGEQVLLTDPPEDTEIQENKISGDVIKNINTQDLVQQQEIKYQFESDLESNIQTTAPYQHIELTNRTIPAEIKPNYKGYIVKYKEKPLAEKKYELEQEIEENERYLREASFIKRYTIGLIKQIDLPYDKARFDSRINKQKENLKKEHERVKPNIEKKLNKNIDKIRLNEYDKVFNGLALDITDEEAIKLKEIKDVEEVYPNYEVKTLLTDSVPLINADDVWLLDIDGNNCAQTGKDCLTGKDITIAVIDTGVDYTHPDLGGCTTTQFLNKQCNKVIDGYDFVTCDQFNFNTGVCEVQRSHDSDPMDDFGHGTHVAATAAGNGVLKGVAPDAKIVAYKVLNKQGSGLSSWIISGIERAIDPNQDGNFVDHYDIISMSLGGPGGPDHPQSQAVDNAVNNGVVAVIAAGNSGPQGNAACRRLEHPSGSIYSVCSPGTAREAITVGASDKNNLIAGFSSRGPVIASYGRVTMKPDIVAPGVSICAAQWNGWLTSNRCLDDKHIAISGTSMATPHVAGAAALLKQKNPSWNPNEIKMVLRNTAIDLGRPVTDQGRGKLDILKGIKSGKLPFATLQLGTALLTEGKIAISGVAMADNFKEYALYYGKGENPSQFTQFYISSIPGSFLYSDFDTTLLDDGTYTIKLIVLDNNNQVSEDEVIFSVKNLNLMSVGDNLNYIKGVENVKGKIYALEYDSFKVEYRKEGSEIWNQICYDTKKPQTEILCTIDVSSFSNGAYYFRLSMNKGGKWINGELLKTVVFKELLDNWPKEISAMPQGFPNIGYENNNAKLVVPHPDKYMGGGLYLGYNISVFNSDGTSQTFNRFYDGTTFYKIPFDRVPSIYYDAQQDKDYLALIHGFPVTKPEPDSPYSGIINFEGNYIFKWPREIYGSSFAIYGDRLFNIKLDTTTKLASVNGYRKDGTLLNNFPISIVKEPGTETLVLDQPRLLGKDSNSIAVIAGNYNLKLGLYNWFWLTDLVLYLDIYSFEKTVSKKRVYLYKDLESKLVDMVFTPFIVGDMNNDGNSEIVVAFSIVDIDLYSKNIYDINAYKTFFYIINSNGNVVSNFEIKGYIISQIVLGEFDDEVRVVATLLNTYGAPVSYNKIISFDYSGKLAFDINLDDSNELIGGVVVGDIDLDRESEIIINYRPRFFDGGNSGFIIFNGKGFIEREIEIPTTGDADDYSFGFGPILTDFNNDGKVDIIQESRYVDGRQQHKIRIFAFNLNSRYVEPSWSMFQHDPQHTGLYIKPQPPKSMIENFEIKDLEGYLTMEVQKFNYVNDVWESKRLIAARRVTIPAKSYLALDTIWKEGPYTTTEKGKYRVYAELRSINGVVGGVMLSNGYEFKVACEESYVETKITGMADQYYPSIYKDKIVYYDNRNGNWDIYMHDLTTGIEKQITTSTASQLHPTIYGDKIVWMDDRNGNWDIYMHDLTTGIEKQITTNTGLQQHPKIYENKIVWEDFRNGNWDIYMYDLTTNTERQITTDLSQGSPAIYGNIIVWSVYNSSSIYMYDLNTGIEKQIISGYTDSKYYPSIYGDKIVYQGVNIYVYDLNTGIETTITDKLFSRVFPKIYKDKIVYQDWNGHDIYMYDLTTNTEKQITTDPANQKYPSMYEDRIVWQDRRNNNFDIYMASKDCM